MNISFDESSLPSIVSLNSYKSSTGDTINITAIDENENSYKLQLTSMPYDTINGLKSITWRWLTGNEWACLGITLAGAVISGGVGIYCTIANAIAICIAEDKSSGDISKIVRVKGWFNDNPEFLFQEDVFEEEYGTNMNAALTIYIESSSPLFQVDGFIESDSSISLTFNKPTMYPTLVWNNLTDPLDYDSIPDPINQLISHFSENSSPYTIRSTRDALLGELIRLTQ